LQHESVNSPSPLVEPPLGRHQLVRVHPAAWQSLLESRPDLAGEPLLEVWATREWPLVVRRRGPLDGDGVLLGLPLPPCAGKRRIALEICASDIVSVSSLPRVSEVLHAAPLSWWPALQELTGLALAYGVDAGVFGSLGWQWLTGLPYLGPQSDLDIAWTLPPPAQLDQFLADLTDIDERAPMRLDGELLDSQGAGANWRELCAGCPELVLKCADQVTLTPREEFIGAAP
jgi:phosphoribosyl-dephospho-CoA transferase